LSGVPPAAGCACGSSAVRAVADLRPQGGLEEVQVAWIDYFKTMSEQLAMLLAGTTEAGVAIPSRGVDIKAVAGATGMVSATGGLTAALNQAAYTYGDGRANANVYQPAGLDGTIQRFWTAPHQFNGVTWDRERNNEAFTLFASAARTATVSCADQMNCNGRGIMLGIMCTASADTPSVVPTLEVKLNTTYYTLLTGGAITGTCTRLYIVYPGVGVAAGGVDGVAGFLLGRVFRLTMTHADADSITYAAYATALL